MRKMTGIEILQIPMAENDSRARTIGGYLTALLKKLWEEDEGFSGKRPFGNSGWNHDIAIALVEAKAIRGTIEKEDGYTELTEYDETAMNKAILSAIKALWP